MRIAPDSQFNRITQPGRHFLKASNALIVVFKNKKKFGVCFQMRQMILVSTLALTQPSPPGEGFHLA